ncbi:heat shock factor 1 isoform X3 [Paramuricea clavata]|uniref:Heat shock factor 1 isoform X3 n=1 Tax=Paramuricea clavata TaxID=317549 RepID=A0A7D9HNJ8_PARCT|nr:heat shock factor 1 isoform X3 [Paramuricea clavata]
MSVIRGTLLSMENRTFTISSGVPAFLAKLWKLVDDPSSDHLISWSQDETSFIVHDQVTFSRDILPKYFKHNNFASFVRQLNMYGFRKVVGAEQGGLKAEKDDWQFQNANFIRSQPRLLENVKRKSTPDDKKVKGEEYNRVLSDIHHIKGKQVDMSSVLDQVKMENQSLYQELGDLRQKHEEQEQVVNKLIRFLMKLLYSNNGLTNKRPLMLTGPESGNPKRQCTTGVNMDNPGASQQDSYNMRKMSSYPETSGPEITPVDDPEDYVGISISAVRPIVNEPGNPPSTSDETYHPLRHLPIESQAQSHYSEDYRSMPSQQPRIVQPSVQTYNPVSTMCIMPSRSTPTTVSSQVPNPINKEQLQNHVQYIEDNLYSFQNILAGGNYNDPGMLDDLLDSIVDGRESPGSQTERVHTVNNKSQENTLTASNANMPGISVICGKLCDFSYLRAIHLMSSVTLGYICGLQGTSGIFGACGHTFALA